MARPATPSSRTWTLYHVPPSFYSQVARLVLTEKQIAYRAVAAVPGPPNFGTYRPWYMRLNPMGTVPTLVRGDEVETKSPPGSRPSPAPAPRNKTIPFGVPHSDLIRFRVSIAYHRICKSFKGAAGPVAGRLGLPDLPLRRLNLLIRNGGSADGHGHWPRPWPWP